MEEKIQPTHGSERLPQAVVEGCGSGVIYATALRTGCEILSNLTLLYSANQLINLPV